jgi:site-specific DNA recombinase
MNVKRAAIYARFSSDRQNERSIADQVALCRDWCARQGYAVAAVFEDHAISGASLIERAGMQSLLAASGGGTFDLVVAESLSRIGRDEEDRAAIRKRLAFRGITMATPADGVVSPIVDGIRAVIDSAYLDDLKRATRRGLEGVVRDGRHAGGRAYGYAAVPGKPGELAIVESEAEIVREIFVAYAAGETPRTIAARLNTRGVKPPRGQRWNASTINGDRKRGSGIILNDLYTGRIVWNKVRMVKDPATGKRVSRPNPPGQYRTAPAEHLRIVDDATWRAAQAVKSGKGHQRAHAARKPTRFLSGLLRCGSCGAGMTSVGVTRGQARLQCSAFRESGTCDNGRKVPRETVERVVLDALRDHLADPALIAEYAAEYNRERARLARAADGRRAKIERREGEIARELDRVLDAIVKTGADPTTFATRIKQLEAERGALAAELAALARSAPVIALHPASLKRYRADVERLAELLAGSDEGAAELIAAVRALVARVTVHAPPGARDLRVEIHGRLAELTGAPGLVAEGGIDGSGGGTRTPDTRIMIPLL